MKAEDIPIFEQKVLKILPAKQSDIWKKLDMGHRDCSELISIMLKKRLIKKTKSGSTYLIESLNGANKHKKKNYHSLLSKSGKFAPCAGCILDCKPTTCQLLTNWLLE